jgi:hypothetical protein
MKPVQSKMLDKDPLTGSGEVLHEDAARVNRSTPPDGHRGHLIPSQGSLSSQVFQLQRMQLLYGNQFVGDFIQRSVEVSDPNDEYEREADRVADQADRVADQVMRIPDPTVQRKPT